MKNPQFSYNRLKGADPVAGVEMASTGEVACFGKDEAEAFYLSWLATDQNLKGKSVFITLSDPQKHRFLEVIRPLSDNGWTLYTTSGTHKFLSENGIKSNKLYKISENKNPSVASAIEGRKIDLIINVPTNNSERMSDGFHIRRLAVDNHIPLISNAETGKLLLKCLTDPELQDLQPKYWDEYVPKKSK